MPQDGILGEEKACETVVWETPVSRARRAQRGPAGAVVEVVEGVDEVAVGSGRELGPGKCAHVVSVRRGPETRPPDSTAAPVLSTVLSTGTSTHPAR